MLDPLSLIVLHTIMMWSIAAAFWLVYAIEKGWEFPWQWAAGFTLMPLIMVIGGIAEQLDHDGLRVLGFFIGMIGPLILIDGIRAFVRQPPHLMIYSVGIALFTGGILVATYIMPSLSGRFLVFQLGVLVGSVYGVWLLRFMAKEDHALGRPLAFVTGVIPIIAAVLQIGATLAGAYGNDPDHAAAETSMLILAATVIAVFKAIDKVVLVAERMSAKIGREARVDVLTGLATRRVFDQQLAQELLRRERSGRPLSVILFDVDFFKSINDTHGHDVGDAALQRVADCARLSVRPSDLATRLGGDEFAVLLPETDSSAATVVAQRILDAMRAVTFSVPTGDVRLAGSFGVSTATERMTPAELVKRADEALYVVKRRGRNGVEAAV
jgi:diguanylate cyclase (GGDEF)-like protein